MPEAHNPKLAEISKKLISNIGYEGIELAFKNSFRHQLNDKIRLKAKNNSL